MGTFRIIGGRKAGGNVATYFCTADGRVLHAIAGPVGARILLREAQWVLDVHEKAKQAGQEGDAEYVKLVRQAHAGRLDKGSKDPVDPVGLQAAVHRLLANDACDDIEKVYPQVWQGILKEKVSNDPVGVQGFPR